MLAVAVTAAVIARRRWHRHYHQINDEVLKGFWSWYDDLSDVASAE